ncbi:unnamed protein product [Rhizophagus irregularis]|uniref:Uncharacterized protein n=1 Tax=Rhizophagus irregularis TaxID=588596 RepID=A0A916DYR1_9GLOM|nr:unnamed protein product [Rhizophagus irregularis]
MQFEAGLATLFDMKSVEEENYYFYVRKSDNSQIFESPYNGKYVELNKGAIDSLKPLFKKLEQKHLDKALCRKGYYLTNILTAYNEIIRLYYLQGGSVFLPRNNISERNSDPFKPPELSKRGTSNKGVPPKVMAKPQKISELLKNKVKKNKYLFIPLQKLNSFNLTTTQTTCYITKVLFIPI